MTRTTKKTLADALRNYRYTEAGSSEIPALDRLAGFMGDLSLDALTRQHAVNYRKAHKVARKAGGKGLTDSTLNKDMTVLKRALVAYNRIHPGADRIELPYVTTDYRPRPLTSEEVHTLLTYLHTVARGVDVRRYQEASRLAVLMVNTGMRFNEASDLRGLQVPEPGEAPVIRVYRSKVGRWGEIPLNTKAISVLRNAKESVRADQYLFAHWVQGSATRVWDRTDEPIRSPRLIRDTMNKLGFNSPEKVAQRGRVDVRSLRDTYATALWNNGVPLETIKEILGHKKITQTLKYAQLKPETIMEQVKDVLI